MKTYKTFLPLFPGFYNTIFDVGSFPIENMQKCINITIN